MQTPISPLTGYPSLAHGQDSTSLPRSHPSSGKIEPRPSLSSEQSPNMQGDRRMSKPGMGVYIPPHGSDYGPGSGIHHPQYPYTPLSAADATPSSVSASLAMARPSDSSSHNSFAHSHSSHSTSQPQSQPHSQVHSANQSPYLSTNKRPSLTESGHLSSNEKLGEFVMIPQGGAAEGSEGSENGDRSYDGVDGEGKAGESSTGEKRKKPRITLARGGACVACRNRKLKCTGELPCKTCVKAKVDCIYQELPKKKPRAQLLEERVAELEAILTLRGEPVPPSQLGPSHTPDKMEDSTSHRLSISSTADRMSHSHASSSAPSVPNHLQISNSGRAPELSLMSHETLAVNMTSVNSSVIVPPGSVQELGLITLILPYTPYLLIPVHPQRFLALLSLPEHDPQRPHPALLYILFAEAVKVLERDIPLPQTPPPPTSLFPHNLTPPYPAPTVPHSVLLNQFRGTGLSLLERARTELDSGIRTVNRPFDLVRAAIGIARHLYSLGRFIEGWNVPVSRLLISCGLHRATGRIVPPDTSPISSDSAMPRPYASTGFYIVNSPGGYNDELPVLRMRPVIIPPPRDDIELALRNAVFWAGKMQDWEAGVGWGWTTSLADEECTTPWPWGQGGVEFRPTSLQGTHYGISDLFDPHSPMHSSIAPDSTYTLAIKSLNLLHSANHLFDRPEADSPIPTSAGMLPPTHIAPLATVQKVETAIRLFRQRIPTPFLDPGSTPSPPPNQTLYEGHKDPWWIVFHFNLLTAEMLLFRELAHHQRQAYESAVGAARAILGFARRLPSDCWVHVDMIVALNISLASRFLFKEADRLGSTGQPQAAALANEEAEALRNVLGTDYARWLPMASLHALIVQRVREGWPEKEGEYERV